MLLSVLKDIFFSKAGAQTPEALSQAPWRTVVEPPAQVPAAPAPASGPALPLPKTLADLLQEPASPPPGSVQLDENLSLVSGRHGIFLANRFDRHLGCALDRYGECKELQLRLIQALVGSGDTVVEVGASIGAHTVPLAKKVGPEGRVVAIEPQPVIAQALAASVALNSLENVSVLNRACGAGVGTRWLPAMNYFGGAFHHSSKVALAEEATEGGQPVELVSLNELLPDVPRVALLRVEVSGMELAVLQGASRWLDAEPAAAVGRPIIYVANPVLEHSPALIEYLSAAGYRLWWHLPSFFNPENHFGRDRNDYDELFDICMIALPQEAALPAELSRLTPVAGPQDHPLRPPASDPV
jgi:FkbM family methyltransferase